MFRIDLNTIDVRSISLMGGRYQKETCSVLRHPLTTREKKGREKNGETWGTTN